MDGPLHIGAQEAPRLCHDEIGRAWLEAGPRRWHSHFAPVYRFDAGVLHPVLIEARTVCETSGAEQLWPPASPGEASARAMHRANMCHRDGEELGYVEQWRAPGAITEADVDALFAAAEIADIAAQRIVVEFDLDRLDDGPAQIAACRVVALGGRIGLRVVGPRLPVTLPAPGGVRPAIIGFSRRWTDLADEGGGAAALRLALREVAAQGCAAWLGAIATPGQLDAALDAGARFVSGPLMAAPVQAGRYAGWRPINAAALAAGDRDVSVIRRA